MNLKKKEVENCYTWLFMFFLTTNNSKKIISNSNK